ncbi:hypothetical protein LTR62_007719 [Meristemomyces frigidus]|uniref:SMODS and SLOG-associating 2TM effector domain-containing protein n=1 Tax=Meristemomyces frigidus TaxID=1508187 RepID=A0AAN7YNS6_9PEZI|nr:hypothetical protein LTR62_007719 [Meristemomyces frigidus]
MHELPKDLANSVRSWRASIYKEPADVEKAGRGDEDYGDKEFERVHPQHHATQQQLRTNTQSSTGAPQNQSTVANTQAGQPPQPPASAKNLRPVFSSPAVNDIDPAASRLDSDPTPLDPSTFYYLIGMKPPLSKHQNPKDLVIEHGLYSKIQIRLRYVQTMYLAFDILANALLIIQLFLSAVFIVIGSLARTDTHVAVAALGAAATVVAGTLALMKGNGLPNRLRQTRDNLRNVEFEAEELYWDVGAGKTVRYRDVVKLREDFLRVLEEARRNHPDTWNPIAKGIAVGIRRAPEGKGAGLVSAATPVV